MVFDITHRVRRIFRYVSFLNILPILVFGLSSLSARAAFPDSHGIFYIRGFANSHLIWQPMDQSESNDLGILGATANRVKVTNDYVLVVHSGEFQTGSGSALWFASVQEVTQAISQHRSVSWIVQNFTNFSNAYDAAVTGDTAWVTLLGTSQIVGIRLSANQQLVTVATQPNPQDILIANRQLYVSGSGFGSGRSVALHNLTSGALQDSIVLGTNPQGLCSYRGDVYVACSGTSWTQPPVAGNGVMIDPTGQVSIILHASEAAYPASVTATTQGRIVMMDGNSSRVFQVEPMQPQGLQLVTATNVAGGWNVEAGLNDTVYVSSLSSDSIIVFGTNWTQHRSIFTGGDPAAMTFWSGRSNSVSDNNFLLPNRQIIQSAYPNPFNSSTNVLLRLPQNVSGSLVVFDRTGREIQRQIVQSQTGGDSRITIRLTENASGIYYAQWLGRGEIETIALELVK